MQVVIENKVWCELESRESKCFYKIFPAHIPYEYGGEENASPIEGVVLCESREDAVVCASAIAALIENGYGENPRWLIGMDMGDLMRNIWDGRTVHFVHGIFQHAADNDSMQMIKYKVTEASVILLSITAPCEVETGELNDATSAILPVSEDMTVLWQVALLNGSDKKVDVWYR
jgi:hypothetical protein